MIRINHGVIPKQTGDETCRVPSPVFIIPRLLSLFPRPLFFVRRPSSLVPASLPAIRRRRFLKLELLLIDHRLVRHSRVQIESFPLVAEQEPEPVNARRGSQRERKYRNDTRDNAKGPCVRPFLVHLITAQDLCSREHGRNDRHQNDRNDKENTDEFLVPAGTAKDRRPDYPVHDTDQKHYGRLHPAMRHQKDTGKLVMFLCSHLTNILRKYKRRAESHCCRNRRLLVSMFVNTSEYKW